MICFPEVPRVRYGKNPLVEVVCQLRFPRILKLDTQPPAEFQEAMGSSYPAIHVSQSFDVSVPAIGSSPGPAFGVSRSQSYEFLTKDRRWKLVLAPDFLALSTPKYERWEEFSSRLDNAIKPLIRLYKPAVFTRIGLRYQDVVMRSDLGLTDKRWGELLNPAICGVLSVPAFEEQDLSEVLSVFSGKISEDAVVRVRHGFAQQNERDEVGYLIDADFFILNEVEVDDALGRLDAFNVQARYLFRWCITQALHEAMEPHDVSS